MQTARHMDGLISMRPGYRETAERLRAASQCADAESRLLLRSLAVIFETLVREDEVIARSREFIGDRRHR